MDDKQISGEQYRQMNVSSSQAGKPSPKKRTVTVPVLWLVIIVVVGLLAFFGGVHYGKAHAPKTTSTATAAGRGGFGGAGGTRHSFGDFGTVSAVTSTSITISNQRTNSNQTFSITSSTQITDNGQTVDYTDIQTGDTVIIKPSTSSASTAGTIMVNPSFGGGAGGQAAPGSSSSDGTNTTN